MRSDLAILSLIAGKWRKVFKGIKQRPPMRIRHLTRAKGKVDKMGEG